MTPAHYALIAGCVMFIAVIVGIALLKSSPRDEYPHENVESDNG